MNIYPDREAIAGIVRSEAAFRGMSTVDLAEAAGVSIGVMRDLKAGRRHYRIDELIGIAATLGIGLADLLCLAEKFATDRAVGRLEVTTPEATDCCCQRGCLEVPVRPAMDDEQWLEVIGLRPIFVEDLRHEAILLPRFGLLLLEGDLNPVQRQAAIERAIAASVAYLNK